MNNEFLRFSGEQPPSRIIKEQDSQKLAREMAQFIHDGGSVKEVGKTKKIDIFVNKGQVVNLNTISQVANKRKKAAAKRREFNAKK